MNTIIAYIKGLIARFLHGDLTKVLAVFDAASAKAEKYISIAQDDLAKLKSARDSIDTALVTKNADIDRAYRIVHNLSQLSA